MAAMSWKEVVEVVEVVGSKNEGEKHAHVRKVIRKASPKLNLAYSMVIEGIKSTPHATTTDAMNLLQSGHFGEWLNKLKMVEKELEAATPKIQYKAIVPVREFIR
jgi:hypothetical protein